MRKAFYLCVLVFLLLMAILLYAEFASPSRAAASAAKDAGPAGERPAPVSDASKNEIEDILKRYYETARTNDREALLNFSREITAAEYRYSSELGTKDKQMALRHLESGRVEYIAADFDDLSVQVFGDTAIAKYRDHSKVRTRGGVQRSSTRFTNVWVKRDGRWQVVAEHSSQLARPIPMPRHPLADNLARG